MPPSVISISFCHATPRKRVPLPKDCEILVMVTEKFFFKQCSGYKMMVLQMTNWDARGWEWGDWWVKGALWLCTVLLLRIKT